MIYLFLNWDDHEGKGNKTMNKDIREVLSVILMCYKEHHREQHTDHPGTNPDLLCPAWKQSDKNIRDNTKSDTIGNIVSHRHHRHGQKLVIYMIHACANHWKQNPSEVYRKMKSTNCIMGYLCPPCRLTPRLFQAAPVRRTKNLPRHHGRFYQLF